MKLEDIGYNDELEKLRIAQNLKDFEMGRVISEHRERYVVQTENGELEAEITGNLRFSSKGREDFPAVGDWVALTIHDNDFSIIHAILPRFSVLSRPAVGKFGEIQIIATNIDYALLVQAADRDFNINRLERYLTVCNSSHVSPIVIITKIDLIDENQTNEILENIQSRIKDVPVVAISNESKHGYDKIRSVIKKGKTYCLLGSSGVGKSTLFNNLSGRSLMQTGTISHSTNKGRHVTSHRELTILENGGILIDNPGMREVGIADSSGGLEITFDMITQLAQNCRFKDCTHTVEVGCAVIDAVNNGEIDEASYENFLRLGREKTHFESSVAEKRKKEKAFGKLINNYKKDLKKGKFD